MIGGNALVGLMTAAALVAPAGVPAAVAASGQTTGSTQVTMTADSSNLKVTVPTVIPFVMNADGTLTSASEGALQITNQSNFAIHVTDVKVANQGGFNIVADATQASEDNAVDFQFGVADHLIDAASPAVPAGSYNLAPVGDAAAVLDLTAQGNAKNVKADIASAQGIANITWSFAAGSANA